MRISFGWNTSEFFDDLRGVLFDRLRERGKVLRALLNERRIGQAFVDDDVHESIEKGHVRPGL